MEIIMFFNNQLDDNPSACSAFLNATNQVGTVQGLHRCGDPAGRAHPEAGRCEHFTFPFKLVIKGAAGLASLIFITSYVFLDHSLKFCFVFLGRPQSRAKAPGTLSMSACGRVLANLDRDAGRGRAHCTAGDSRLLPKPMMPCASLSVVVCDQAYELSWVLAELAEPHPGQFLCLWVAPGKCGRSCKPLLVIPPHLFWSPALCLGCWHWHASQQYEITVKCLFFPHD